MAHRTLKTSHDHLIDRLNRHPQGVPPSEVLYKILQMLFSEREAGLVALLPMRPFTIKKAAQIWKMKGSDAKKTVEELAARAILVDTISPSGQQIYVLPPPMAGFFEFSLMRLRGDINQKVLSELFYQYMNVEEEFIKALFTEGETQLGRVFVQEAILSSENALHVLDYERASEVIKTASHRGIGMCYCRHKMQHMDRACAAPMDICMTFNASATSLIKHEYAREVGVAEGLDLLQEAQSRSLVQFGENVREQVNFICNCCGCCCEAMIAGRKFGFLQPIHTTNFLPQIDEAVCNGCGKCVTACPVEAMTLVSTNDPHRPKMKKAQLLEDICLGCGVCVSTCSQAGIQMKSRPQRVITPLNSAHRTVVMAIERGTLPNFIFDNQVMTSHRALAAVLGIILKLPPIKQAMASEQMKSRYLERLLVWGTQRANY